MLIKPDSTTRVAFGETASFELSVDSAISKVCLRLGEHSEEIETNAGALVLSHSFQPPAIVDAEWYADGSKDAVARTKFEIVSQHYFTLDDLRNYGNGTDDFSTEPEEKLWAVRQAATETFERNAKRSFVHRCGKTRIYGTPTFVELDDCDVYEITSPKQAQLVSDCQVKIQGNYKNDTGHVLYKYGADQMPARVSLAVLDLAAYYLRADVASSRAVGEATDAGFLRFTIAGRDGATGLPEVDAAIQQFGRKRYGVA